MAVDYAKMLATFWTGETGRAMRPLGSDVRVVAAYLITGPNRNMIGLYSLEMPLMVHHTGIPLEGLTKALRSLEELNFCRYDAANEIVWVLEMARVQIGDGLKSTDKQCAGVQNIYDSVPSNRFLGDFFDRYSSAFNMTRRRDPRVQEGPPQAPYQAPSKPAAATAALQQQQQHGGVAPVPLNGTKHEMHPLWVPGSPIADHSDLQQAVSSWGWGIELRIAHKAALRTLLAAGPINGDEQREARKATDKKKANDPVAFFLGTVNGIREDHARITARGPGAPPKKPAKRGRGWNEVA